MPYSQIFKDYLEHPRNGGEVDNADVVAEETNPVCGDRLRLALKINEGTIEVARFLAYGCPPVLVCGSALTELIQGKTVEEALRVTRKQLVESVGGLPARKQHAAALAIETLQAAIRKVV